MAMNPLQVKLLKNPSKSQTCITCRFHPVNRNLHHQAIIMQFIKLSLSGLPFYRYENGKDPSNEEIKIHGAIGNIEENALANDNMDLQATIDGAHTPHAKRTKSLPASRRRPTMQIKALTRSEIAEKYGQLLDKRLEVADLQKKKLEDELLTIEECACTLHKQSQSIIFSVMLYGTICCGTRTCLHARTYVLNERRDGGETPSAITGDSIWYTEGIKTASGTGSGIVEKGRTGEMITLNLGTTTTAFQANILAITNCARKMKETAYTRKQITIVTGDEATIKALESYTIRSQCVLDCVKELTTLAGSSNRGKLTWATGTNRSKENEIAAELAKAGTEKPLTNQEPACGISHAQVRGAVGQWILEQHRKYWEETPRLHTAKQLVSSNC
ncbi:hypothetical protein HUJ05_007704 [Dendroctonus ponderosae]|nr:hypothetical protein HUJ05_007704 [Dendroctonus ponderosae]